MWHGTGQGWAMTSEEMRYRTRAHLGPGRYMHTRAHTCTHAHMHTCTHTHTHAHTCTHMHTYARNAHMHMHLGSRRYSRWRNEAARERASPSLDAAPVRSAPFRIW